MEPVAPMAVPGAACERCGTFSPLSPLAGKSLCPDCCARVAKGAKYWSSGYLTGIGCLLNPAASAVLLAINYRRLGDAEKGRNWAIGAAVLVAIYAAVVAFAPNLPGGALLGGGIAAGIGVGRSWAPTWDELSKLGAGKASAVLPILATIGVVIGLVVIVVLITPG